MLTNINLKHIFFCFLVLASYMLNIFSIKRSVQVRKKILLNKSLYFLCISQKYYDYVLVLIVMGKHSGSQQIGEN